MGGASKLGLRTSYQPCIFISVVNQLEVICYGCDRHFHRFKELTSSGDYLLYSR
jgi:hypothetical protein